MVFYCQEQVCPLPTARGAYALACNLPTKRRAGWLDVASGGADSTVANPCTNGIVVPEPQNRPDLVTACEGLLTIHARLTGDHHRNWNADTPINQWYGVVVSNSRVTELDLAGNLEGGSRRS